MARTDHKPRRRLDPQTRRSAIIAAAGQAFSAQPYEQVSVAAIAAEAGASEALLYRYFASKPGLYAETLRAALTAAGERQRQAVAALPANADARAKVQAHLEAYLDAASATGDWASGLLLPGNEPADALAVRSGARAEQVAGLRELLGDELDDYVVYGYLGFVDAACAQWVSLGSPQAERPVLVEGALTALFGVAGDESAGRLEPRRRSKFGNRR